MIDVGLAQNDCENLGTRLAAFVCSQDQFSRRAIMRARKNISVSSLLN